MEEQPQQPQQPKNPLNTLWKAIQSVGAILGISSFVQRSSGDLLQWRGFILDVVESYRAIVTPVFEYSLGWMFDVPPLLVDYLVIGFLIFSSSQLGLQTSPPPSLELELRGEGHRDLSGFQTDHTVFRQPVIAFLELRLRSLMVTLFQSPVWPIYLGMAAIWFYRYGSEHKERRSEVLRGAQWLGAVLLGSLFLLAINSQL